MGKSVFLGQLHRELEQDDDLRVLLVPGPPSKLTVEACLERLAHAFEVDAGRAQGAAELIDAYFARGDVPERLVLLFDEFDRYAESGNGVSANPPGRGFFNDLEISRRSRRGLAVLATGSIGVFAFRDVLGSSFLSRAEQRRLTPFDRDSAATLARPFADRGTPLTEEVLDAVQLASGGIPALLTYGFEQLWEIADRQAGREPVEADVTEIYVRFQEVHGGYLDDVQQAFSDPRLSQAPQRVLELIRLSPGALLRDDVAAVSKIPGDALKLSVADVLELLQAAGLVRVEGSAFRDNPVRAYPIPSLINLPAPAPTTNLFRDDFLRDLETLLAKLHRSSADYFRPTRGRGKVLVPESVFAAHLALGFELLGWRSEREAQSAAGRTDVKLRRNGSPEVAVIEVKIWGRPGFREVHRQVESYWTAEVAAGAVVQLTDAELPDWPETYLRDCLGGQDIAAESLPVADSPLRGHFAATSTTPDGLGATVDHLLLRLPRR